MKNNLIPFSKTSPDCSADEDDFCGAAGAMFENISSELTLPQSASDTAELYKFEAKITQRLHAALNLEGVEQASIIFDEPEALKEEFKQVLLEVLARNKKVAHRSRRILTVSHPEMSRKEQVPFLRELSPIPELTLRAATPEELDLMYELRTSFPELLDARNAINSVQRETSTAYFF